MASSRLLTCLRSSFIQVSFLLAFTYGWEMASTLCKNKPITRDNNSVSDRRDFLQSSLLASATITSAGTLSSPQTATAADSDDPFAALDSFAATIGSTPPSSINPPPSKTGNSASPSSDTKQGATQPTGSSDMSEALKDMRKQRQIDPRTHG
mmetsp:Transcript_36536/g.88551  ORF Transcript_36536/g.88551 Transcript_36536/m.88551 type:complete len:152 (-) Transcript_36536:115-570(-)